MPGRTLCTDAQARERGFADVASAQRRRILHETIAAFERCEPRDHYHRLAAANLARWRTGRPELKADAKVQVFDGDWGCVTLSLTKHHGVCFAVLNMANAYVPGGAYVEGAMAQEENIFRRTDSHFEVGLAELDSKQERYQPEMTDLLSARHGRVYLDTHKPRVCVRGPEDRSRPDLGYEWLQGDEVFPFYELRAAAQDLRDGREFDLGEARRRIAAQLDTLRAQGLRHAVLGAFGCGAFQNPASTVARIYKEEIDVRQRDFSLLAFAILAPGYGPDNYKPFASVFGAN